MIKLIFYGILIYILYKLIFDFIIPVSRATRQIKTKIRQAQEQQQRFEQQRQHTQQQEQVERKTPPASNADYIDFEEVK